jgi:hypothetical protein
MDMSTDYVISRKSMYAALVKLGVNVKAEKIPVGVTGEWTNVEVETGYPWADRQFSIILPKVTLAARGVANRVRVICPCCFTAEVRFGGLAQHAQTARCQALNRKRLARLQDERHQQAMEKDPVLMDTTTGKPMLRGLRQTYVKMADHEWSSNTSMEKIAEEILLKDPDPAYPRIVIVSDQAGW